MKTSAYLIIDQNGIVMTRKNKPKLESGQAMVKLELDISDDIFESLVPTVSISVPDDYVQRPSVKAKLKEGTMDKLLGEDK